MRIHQLRTVTDTQVAQLASVLLDCLEGGASVSFMAPLTRERAEEAMLRVAGALGMPARPGLG